MKFFIALVLALAVCGFASAQQSGGGPQDGAYVPIQWDANNQTLVDLLNFGVQSSAPQAIAAGQLANSNEWFWTDVISAQVQVIPNDGTFFDFVADIEDINGDTARMEVIVFSIPPDYSAESLYSWTILKM